MGGYGTNVVHSYGSDAILNAWNQVQGRKRQQRAAKDNAITQAILQGASTGDIPDFKLRIK